MSKRYEIGGKAYRLDELVLDQEEALADLLEPLYGGGETTAQALVDALLRKKLLKKALAIILMPEGEDPEKVDRAEVERHLGRHMSMSQQAAVVRDFFAVNAGALSELKALAAEASTKGTAAASTR